MNKDNYKIINYINENYDIRELYKEVMGRDPGHGKCFCPFHNNRNTPAAKIYDNRLKCFGECNRLFGPYDFLKRFYPDEINKVKTQIILPETKFERIQKERRITRNELDLTLPVSDVIKQILEYDTKV